LPTFVAIDFETANNARDSACAVGMVRVEAGQVVDQFTSFIRPPTNDFNFYCVRVHGLGWADVRNAPDFEGIWREAQAICEGVQFFAAHNAPFDRSVLNACCAYYGIPKPTIPFLNTVTLARRSWRNLPKHGLAPVCQHLGISLNHHEAGSDALACAKIVLAAGSEAVSALLR
jgi:DNA polymerase-3 subunit epsilon